MVVVDDDDDGCVGTSSSNSSAPRPVRFELSTETDGMAPVLQFGVFLALFEWV